jgi:hypothetical protein
LNDESLFTNLQPFPGNAYMTAGKTALRKRERGLDKGRARSRTCHCDCSRLFTPTGIAASRRPIPSMMSASMSVASSSPRLERLDA